MAQEIHKREDMLRDAKALLPRFQLRVGGNCRAELFAGFRGDALSLYFGEDPVFHFNAAGELRRAYADGRLIKAARGRLVAMTRRSTDEAVTLVSDQLSEEAQMQLLADMTRRLADLQAALGAGDFVVAGQEPPDGRAVERLQDWLEMRQAPSIAASPRVI
jgi:hypothetical protein